MRVNVSNRLLAAFLAATAILVSSTNVLAAKSGWYTHPDKLYGIAVPPSARIIEAKINKNNFAIDSTKGYRLNLQVGKTHKESLRQMLGKLEGVYLGQSKTWIRKLSERELTVAGLRAREVVYEGTRIRSRVVIARGKNSDFVFIFTGPQNSFRKLKGEFDWILNYFKPSDDEFLSEKPTVTANWDAKRFSESLFGFAIDYPKDWIFTKPDPTSVMFSGKAGSDAYFSTISIQNIKPTKSEQSVDPMQRVLGDLKSELTSKAQDVRYAFDGAFSYKDRKLDLSGRQFVVTYSHSGQTYKQWTVLLPRPDGNVVHVWSYRTPANRFDQYRTIAETMKGSWKLLASAQTPHSPGVLWKKPLSARPDAFQKPNG